MQLKSNPRAKRNVRKVSLLSHGVAASIYPDSWRQNAQAKKFDADNTAILRTFKHLTEDKFLVYAMRAVKDGGKMKTAAEAYDVVAMAEAVPAALKKVAAHCGIEALVAEVK